MKGKLSWLIRQLRTGIKKICRSLAIFFFRRSSFRIFGIPNGLILKAGKIIEVYPPEAGILMIEKGTATKLGGNLNSSGQLITTYLHSPDGKMPREHDLFRFSTSRFFPKICHTHDTVVVIATAWQANLYHWMFEVLPRLHLVQKTGISFAKIYVESFFHFQTEGLRLLGIQEDKIINAKDFDAVAAPFLIVPSIACEPARWSCDYLQERFVPLLTAASPCKRLYISRRRALTRRIVNEPELLGLLSNYGFETIVMEEFSLLEQMDLFRQAQMIIAPHGAALSHLVFSHSGTHVLELFSKTYVNQCYEKLASLIGVQYRKLFDERHVSGRDPDILVNLEEIENYLQSVAYVYPRMSGFNKI